jgi:SulP family sulfate permease
VILLFVAPLASHVPLVVLAGILIVVSYNMGEWAETGKILRLSKSDISVWLATFTLTVFADLTVAVEFGMILAALLFIRKVTATTTVSEVTEDYVEAGRAHILQDKDIPAYVTVFRIHGPFLFGATDKLDMVSEQLDTLPPVVIVRLRNMTAIDATGLRVLEELATKLHDSGRALLFCGALPQPLQLMKQAGFDRHVGVENMCLNIEDALQRALVCMREMHASAT